MKSFAFLVHPRNTHDLIRAFPASKILPRRLISFATKYVPPFKVGVLKGVKTDSGEDVIGYFIGVPLTAAQFLQDRQHAKAQVLKAVRLASSLGAKHVGLGAFTSVVTDGGKAVAGVVPDIHVTNGNALTAGMAFKGVCKLLDKFPKGDLTVSVVGATGSIGGAVAELCIRRLPLRTVYVVGRTPSHVDELMVHLREIESNVTVVAGSISESVPKSDLVVVATSASDAIITADMLKEGAVVYDVSQPQNVSPDILTQRPDVRVVDGALVQPPSGVRWTLDLGLPKHIIFSCLAETTLLSMSEYPDDFCVGHVTVDQVDYILGIAERHSFALAPFTSFGRLI